ncbi:MULTISPECIES: MFS transporter [Methylococcus]|uniref:MFS transporter n=1 Tax=Methylococcus capsulatus TaxID=414 RepID=A0ABZ2F5E2_METCP|nr:MULTISPECIES: MFS transporter [Methylococcus]MDF9391640.1 MFS transporter [Methylococcus capsulatus]
MADDHRNAHTRLSRNAIASVVGQMIYLIIRVGLPPFILLHVSLQDYSIWATCFLVLGYIGMSTFGIAGVYIRYSAEYYAHGRLDDIGRMMGAGIWLTLALGSFILGTLWVSMPWLYAWFHVEPAMQETMRLLVLGVVGAMLLELLVPYGYVMGGIHRNAENAVISLVCSTLEAVLIVVFLLQGWGLVGMMAAYVLRAVFALTFTLAWFHRLLPGFRIHLWGLGKAQWRPFLEYGGVMQVNGLLSVFLNTSERALAGYITHNPGALGLLDISQKFPTMASQLFNSATNSLLSAITHLHTLGEREELVRLYLRSSRYLNALNGLALGFMAPFATVLITAWMGQSVPVADAGTLLLYAAVGFHIHALTAPVTSYFQAINSPARTFWAFIVPQIVLLAVGLVWMKLRGETSLLTLAAMIMLTRIGSSLGVIVYANAQLGIGQLRFFREVAPIGALPYLVGYLASRAVSGWTGLAELTRWDALGILILFGLAYVAVTAGLVFVLLFRPDERQVVYAVLARLGLKLRTERRESDSPRPATRSGFSRWPVSVAAFGVFIGLGLLYSLALPGGLLASLFAPDLMPTQAWMFGLAVLGVGLAADFGGRWADRVGPRPALFAASLLLLAGLLSVLFGAHLQVKNLVLSGYGMVGGLGLGFGYAATMPALMQVIPARRGTMAGLTLAGFGGGILLVGPLAEALSKLSGNPEPLGMVETAFALGSLGLVLLLAGFALRLSPSDGKLAPVREWRSPRFYLLWLMLFLSAAAGIGLSSLAVPILRGMPSAAGTAVFVGMLALADFGGRLLWGWVSDRVGRKSVYTLVFLGGAALCMALPFIGLSGNVPAFMACCAAAASLFGGGIAALPAYAADVFGTLRLGRVHGRLLMAWAVAAAAVPPLISSLETWLIGLGLAEAHARFALLWMASGLLLIGFLCNLLINVKVAASWPPSPSGRRAEEEGERSW